MWHFIKHFMTITRHRHKVMYHCLRCGILWQGMRHDLSKYSPTEFLPGARFYLGDRSPTEGERREYGYSKAWMHHKGRNKHHFEYWTDYNPKTRRMEAVEMPLKYVKEMFCDRVAATMVYQGTQFNFKAPLDYYNKTHHYYVINENTDRILRDMLERLANSNLDETIEYIKEKYLRNH